MFIGLLFYFIFFCSLEQSVQLVLSWVGCGFKGLEAGLEEVSALAQIIAEPGCTALPPFPAQRLFHFLCWY